MRRVITLVFAAAAAIALEGRAEGPGGVAEASQRARSQRGPREFRTMKVSGGYIRYEVLPDDDRNPPGEVFIVESDRPSQQTQARSEAARRAALNAQYASAAEEQPPVPEGRFRPAHKEPRADGCRRQRGRLAARLLALQGLDVPDDVAAWLLRYPGPTLAQMIQSDPVARGHAEELARCEIAQARR